MADKTYRYKCCPAPFMVDANQGNVTFGKLSSVVTVEVTVDESVKDRLDKRMRACGWDFDQEMP